MKSESFKGFTLIEMVMVLVIIGLLFAIIIPNYMRSATEAKIAKTKAGLEKLRAAYDLYYAKEGHYPMGGPMYELLSPYLNPIPSDGFENGDLIAYSPGLCPLGTPGGWCYIESQHRFLPNLESNQQKYGYEDFGKY